MNPWEQFNKMYDFLKNTSNNPENLHIISSYLNSFDILFNNVWIEIPAMDYTESAELERKHEETHKRFHAIKELIHIEVTHKAGL